MITIQKSLGTIEACQHLKHSLGATSIEHVIEHQQAIEVTGVLVTPVLGWTRSPRVGAAR